MKHFFRKALGLFTATSVALSGAAAYVTTVAPSMAVMAASGLISDYSGVNEGAYVEWADSSAYAGFNVYVSSGSGWTKLDDALIRRYSGYWRADAVGLTPGTYTMKVVPYNSSGAEVTSDAATTGSLYVSAYDRAGFAFSSSSTYGGAGAYNKDGSLKDGALVVYVTPENAKTVTADLVSSSKGSTTTYTGFQNIIYGLQKGYETRPIDIRIVGMVKAADMDSFGSSSEGLQIKGKAAYSNMNLTIEGIGEDSGIHGFGMLIRNSGNVELRNFAVMNCLDDSVSLDTNNCNVWVHNLDLFYGQTGSDSDQAKGDGTVDIKADSTYVTVSYNHFFDNGKSSLCGMKSESENSYITYHHNWFDHSDSRHPRIRTMSVHLYNNYFDGNSKYGVGVTMGSSAFVESNYFRDVKYPMMSSGQGSDAIGDGTFSGENGGMIKAYNNKIVTGSNSKTFYTQDSPASTGYDAYAVSSRTTKVPSSAVAVKGGSDYNNFDTSLDLNVSTSDITSVDSVPSVVKSGAGRINGGDFKWTFSDSDDADYGVNSSLKSALTNYSSPIVSFGGARAGGATQTTTKKETTTTTTTKKVETTTETTTTTTTKKETTTTTTTKKVETTTQATTAAQSSGGSSSSATGTNYVTTSGSSVTLVDTSNTASTDYTFPLDTYESGKVTITGTATPSTVAGKWAFVQVRDSNNVTVAAFGSDANKCASLRTGNSNYITNGTALQATAYSYKFVFDLDANTVTLTISSSAGTETFSGSISDRNINNVYSVTSASGVRNVTLSKPAVSVEAAASSTEVQNFTKDGINSSFFQITGNTSSSKGTVSYSGLTLTTCLKMESKTNITFTAAKAGTLTLVIDAANKTVKVDGKAYTSDANGVIKASVAAGSHTITKGDSCNLFYMVFATN